VAETQKVAIQWPKNSWAILTKIIRAWYTAEQGNSDITQRKIAVIAGVQPSQVSTNKAFLEAIGILTPDGSSLTEAGKRIGIGIGDNESMLREGLQLVIKGNTLLSHMSDIIKGRGELKVKSFSDEIALRMNGKTEGFGTGVTILQEILVSSGSIELVGDTLRPLRGRIEERYRAPENGGEKFNPQKSSDPGLKRIPIPVSTSCVWWVEVGEAPKEGEIDKFLEMQKLMFGTKQNK
jgi:hypothetical protein